MGHISTEQESPGSAVLWVATTHSPTRALIQHLNECVAKPPLAISTLTSVNVPEMKLETSSCPEMKVPLNR